MPEGFPPFIPALGLANQHAQTIFAPLFRLSPRVPLVRERLNLPDGDFLDVDSLQNRPPVPGSPRPILLLLHGLEGSSDSVYIRGMLQQARARNWDAVALNFRSCSGEDNRRPRSYHSGDTGDLDHVLRLLIGRFPGRTFFLCGFSLGGNVLVKWLGEQAEAIPAEVKRACAISVPFDLSACADALDGPGRWARLYCKRFLDTLTVKARRKLATFGPEFSKLGLDVATLARMRSLREFDDRWTGPVHGFTGASDYYAKSSSAPFLERVRVPLLLISAEDDPFIPVRAIPREQAANNSAVRLEVSAHGGHVGFVGSEIRWWAEERAAAWLAS